MPNPLPRGRHAPLTPTLYTNMLRAAAAGLAALLPYAGAGAQPPVPYGGWAVTNGVIDTAASCTGAVTCTVVAKENGFLLQTLTTPQGTYSRMILTDLGASGASANVGFSTETFLPASNNLTGWDIANMQVVRDPAENFQSTAVIERQGLIDNNGNVIDVFNMQLNQTIDQPGFRDAFTLTQHSAAGDPLTPDLFGRTLSLSQSADIGGPGSPVPDTIEFIYREKSGWRGEMVGGWLTASPLTPAGTAALGSETVAWNEGDALAVVWINDLGSYTMEKIENKDATGAYSMAQAISFTDFPLLDPFR